MTPEVLFNDRISFEDREEHDLVVLAADSTDRFVILAAHVYDPSEGVTADTDLCIGKNPEVTNVVPPIPKNTTKQMADFNPGKSRQLELFHNCAILEPGDTLRYKVTQSQAGLSMGLVIYAAKIVAGK